VKASRFGPRWLTAVVAIAAVGTLTGIAVIASAGSGSTPAPSFPASSAVAFDASAASAASSPSGLVVPGTVYQSPTDPEPTGPTFPAIDVFHTASPAPARGALPTDPSAVVDSRRPIPVQSVDWLTLKAAGRIALVGGAVTVLPASADPLVDPSTGVAVPQKRLLDTAWTRWVVEPFGYGSDEKGNSFSNLSYWNLCGDGAMTVALWYWQQLTGGPDVTGTAGYFLDPYAANGVAWPAAGPKIAVSGGTRLGTYWSGSDSVNGFTAHGRGFVMYLAMASQPATWQTPGLALFAGSGKPLYPTAGTSRQNIQTGLNWEISGHNPVGWTEAYYASVIRQDPTLARDLAAAVMLDVGRDGVPVIGAIDTFNLPNWQAGSATPHTRHAIAIVGYDNTANPPTFTYIDTCGRQCNNRGGNQNGQIHVIPQSQMVLAMQNQVGAGFVW
jgi:hypothetical protein